MTLAGRPSVGRVGSAILCGLGREEWIARTEAEYVEKVLALANDLPQLELTRATLRQQMQASPLMDEIGFARKVEAAYAQMMGRWAADHAGAKRALETHAIAKAAVMRMPELTASWCGSLHVRPGSELRPPAYMPLAALVGTRTGTQAETRPGPPCCPGARRSCGTASPA